MTGRTHDLAAFTALTFIFVTFPIPDMTVATLATAVGANFIGGLYPDLDSASSDLWQKIRGGSVLSKIVAPLLGGHRTISHSLLGIVITAFLLTHLLTAINTVLLVDMSIVWVSFMVGYISHIVTDSITKDGVPLLFPLPFTIGFPPLRFLRINSGGLVEKSFIYPGLMVFTGYLFFNNATKILNFVQHHLH